MVYLHVTCQVQRRKVPEWSANYGKIILPLLEKHGQKLVGAWQNTIGTYDEVLDLYAFNSMGDMERVRKELREDPDWIEYMKTSSSFVGLEVSKLMVPFPYSPLQ
ncbi:NIPSNAP family protein [Chloroflexota bacterium]